MVAILSYISCRDGVSILYRSTDVYQTLSQIINDTHEERFNRLPFYWLVTNEGWLSQVISITHNYIVIIWIELQHSPCITRHEVNSSIKSECTWFPHIITSFWKKIDIQCCGCVGIRINLEDATTSITWRTVNNSAASHGASPPLVLIIAEVRSDVSDGFVDRIEFRYLTNIAWNPIKCNRWMPQLRSICRLLLLTPHQRDSIMHYPFASH